MFDVGKHQITLSISTGGIVTSLSLLIKSLVKRLRGRNSGASFPEATKQISNKGSMAVVSNIFVDTAKRQRDEELIIMIADKCYGGHKSDKRLLKISGTFF